MIVNPRTLEAYNLFHAGILALSNAEQNGIRVDQDYIRIKKEQLTGEIAQLEHDFKETKFYRRWEHIKPNINLNSNNQLGHYLYTVLKLDPPKLTESGFGSTDEEALRQLDLPELNTLLRMRKLKKIRDTYLESFEREQVNGFIHPFFNLHIARTFRSSSDSPNFQNIPKRDEEAMQIVRRALYPRPGHLLLEVDYSGIEVRIAACYHKDPNMLRYIKDPSSDMHKDMAKQIFMLDSIDKSTDYGNTLRQAAKNGFVFPQFYGDYYINCAKNMACTWGKLPEGRWKPGEGIAMAAGTLSDHLRSKGIVSLDSFTNHLKTIEDDFWSNRFPEYANWKERWWNIYKKYGYFDTLTGFRCSGVMSKNDSSNYPVQGSAFHCLLWSLIQLDRYLERKNMQSRIINQIHDAILLDVYPPELPELMAAIRKITCEDLVEAWKWIIVPLDIEMEICKIDHSWAEKEKIKS